MEFSPECEHSACVQSIYSKSGEVPDKTNVMGMCVGKILNVRNQ